MKHFRKKHIQPTPFKVLLKRIGANDIKECSDKDVNNRAVFGMEPDEVEKVEKIKKSIIENHYHNAIGDSLLLGILYLGRTSALSPEEVQFPRERGNIFSVGIFLYFVCYLEVYQKKTFDSKDILQTIDYLLMSSDKKILQALYAFHELPADYDHCGEVINESTEWLLNTARDHFYIKNIDRQIAKQEVSKCFLLGAKAAKAKQEKKHSQVEGSIGHAVKSIFRCCK